MHDDAVLFDIHDGNIAVITINRPATRNALSSEVRAGLYAAWDRFNKDQMLKVAILTAAGDKAFCAGGDLREMSATAMGVPPRDLVPVPGDTVDVAKPTIAAINGIAFAGGWLIAQACDLCIAATGATFAITEVKVGRGAPWATPLIHMLPQRIMMEILLTGKPLGAQRACELGYVNQVVEREALLDTALDWARTIAANAPLSVLAAKQTVLLATEMGRSAALAAAHPAWERAYRSEDAQEGPKAFLEKRPPKWRGH